uniref:Amine oxidase domain-containing protein n=1 Tax=Chromera velia CCMP2878 TaxID=1169474 RepID=A0A0G4FSY0_9ALVE|eukprot:Cvel_18471.t1-p1 / transcript=Cvel_18471.t1 / gene=Cvel_18471 / organism=Chromera_velia_CCMP2878 / gene_product=Probable polyamine oxidase 2, putative / transcript_product=Probable polyamine oxidase 2, putative / location=Cvel_scaffold1531:18906-20525(-) / protein_length=540 / sequence_SO=supercontig / SO=protein_coding / is_pseudo=false
MSFIRSFVFFTTVLAGASATEQYDCIVIGGGASGLSTVFHLNQTGVHNVVVLEARERLGGRIHTYTFPETTHRTELGANWLDHINVNPILKLFPETPYVHSDYALSFFSKEVGVWSKKKLMNTFLWGIGVPIVRFLIGTYFSIVPSLFPSLFPSFGPTTSYKDDVSLSQFVTEFLNATSTSLPLSDSEIWSLVNMSTGLEGIEAHKQSITTLMDPLMDKRPKGGGSALPVHGYLSTLQPLYDAFVESIVLGAEVKKVTYGKDFCEVQTAGGREYSAKACVSTLPLGVLKQGVVHFEPPLSAGKQAAIDAVPVGVVNKVALLFEENFWQDFHSSNESESLVIIPDKNKKWEGHFQSLYFDQSKGNGAPVLSTIWAGAGVAKAHFDPKSDEEIVGNIMKSLREMIPNAPDPKDFVVTKWHKDPFSFGSYSSYTFLGLDPMIGSEFVSPESNSLFFAGEHVWFTDPGYVHSAWFSGQCAVQMLKNGDASSFCPLPKHRPWQLYSLYWTLACLTVFFFVCVFVYCCCLRGGKRGTQKAKDVKKE